MLESLLPTKTLSRHSDMKRGRLLHVPACTEWKPIVRQPVFSQPATKSFMSGFACHVHSCLQWRVLCQDLHVMSTVACNGEFHVRVYMYQICSGHVRRTLFYLNQQVPPNENFGREPIAQSIIRVCGLA